MKLNRIAAISALTLVLATGTASAKNAETLSSSSQTLPIAEVNNNSPNAKLEEVGKEVAPGVLEVNPDAIKGKKLVFDQGDASQKIKICIGKWKDGTCKGIYIGS